MKLLDFELEGFKGQRDQAKLVSIQTDYDSPWKKSKNVKRHENWFDVFYFKATKSQLETICGQFLDLVHLDNSNFLSTSDVKCENCYE